MTDKSQDYDRRTYAVIVTCAGPAEFYVPSDGKLFVPEDGFSDLIETSVNGGRIVHVHSFSGQMGIPRHVPFSIESDHPIRGCFASPGTVISDMSIVAVIEEHLEIVASTDNTIEINGKKVDKFDFDTESCREHENTIQCYESREGLTRNIYRDIPYNIGAPQAVKDEVGYRCDRIPPLLEDRLVLCTRYKAVFVASCGNVYLNRVAMPFEDRVELPDLKRLASVIG